MSISIVVPCYNSEKTINRTVDSLLDQIAENYDIILVDDGSNDGTPAICDAYAEKNSQISVIHQPNSGLMAAWKRGVREANGDYVIFCDSDDYVDRDLISRLTEAIEECHTDLVLYGMIIEYDNGDIHKTSSRLKAGYYDHDAIQSMILPRLLSDGGFQSELINGSRCSKAFRRTLILNHLDDLPDIISVGEDHLTMFVSMMNASDVLCIEDFYPYHYVRNAESMIGGYDSRIFDKIGLLFSEMERVAAKYSYKYGDQIQYDRLSVTLVYIKKYICKNPSGYHATKEDIIRVRESDDIKRCIELSSISAYSFNAKLFASAFIHRWYFLLFMYAKLFEVVRGRNV